MNYKRLFVFLNFVFWGAFSLSHANEIAILAPKGTIALQERDLIVTSTLLMLVVVIPVFVLTFFIVWKYRASNKKAIYMPDWASNRVIETIWWAIPGVIILILAIITWKSSHELDPFKPLSGDKTPITIQVVALNWKWLFIYPEQHIASVNFVVFPKDTPVNFEITADAPMNSFWIPQLGGQIYAMPGMNTELHLIATEEGTYKGSSANFSGSGFSGMKFTAASVSDEDFAKWVNTVKSAKESLSIDEYAKLTIPSMNEPVRSYAGVNEGLYDKIIMNYMSHREENGTTDNGVIHSEM